MASSWSDCPRRSQARSGCILGFCHGFWHHAGATLGRGRRGYCRAVSQAATGGEGTSADEGTAAADTGANGAAVEDGTGTSDAAADQGAVSGAVNGDDAADDAAESDNSAAMPAAASEQGEPKAAATSATTLSSKARVCIQDTKDENYSYSTTSGPLKADTRSFGQTCTTRTRTTSTVLPLRLQPRHLDLHLARRPDQAQQQCRRLHRGRRPRAVAHRHRRDGRQILHLQGDRGQVRTTTVRPSLMARASMPFIPGPVLGAGQMETAASSSSSDTPSIGDTLTATPYKDWSSPRAPTPRLPTRGPHPPRSPRASPRSRGATGASLYGKPMTSRSKYIKVEATAGVNTVSKTTSSKVKQAGAVEISAVSIINTKDNTSVFAVGDTAKARAKEKGGAYGAFVDASKLNYQWQCSGTKSGKYTDIAGATGETLELTDALGGKYLKCKVSSKIGSSSMTNSTGALVAAAGSINVSSVTMSPTSGKVELVPRLRRPPRRAPPTLPPTRMSRGSGTRASRIPPARATRLSRVRPVTP